MFRLTFALLVVAMAALGQPGAEPPTLDPHLEPFRPFLGRTFRGEFSDSTPENPIVDVSHYERILGGTAIRNVHSINDGAYGGETLIYWDETRQTLAFFYLTNAGFRTEGTMVAEAGKYISTETVVGNANGITEVRGTAELKPDGTLHVVAEDKVGDAWQPGRDTTYHETDDEVRFP